LALASGPGGGGFPVEVTTAPFVGPCACLVSMSGHGCCQPVSFPYVRSAGNLSPALRQHFPLLSDQRTTWRVSKLFSPPWVDNQLPRLDCRFDRAGPCWHPVPDGQTDCPLALILPPRTRRFRHEAHLRAKGAAQFSRLVLRTASLPTSFWDRSEYKVLVVPAGLRVLEIG